MRIGLPTSRAAFAMAALLAVPIASTACSTGEPGALSDGGGPVDVRVSLLASGPASESHAASLVAVRDARVATRMSGTIRRIPVDVGTAVAAGDPLVFLDDDDVRARVAAASAAAELAETYHGRIQRLAADGAASAQELDQATAERDRARAALRDARAQAAYAIIRAPFAGVVTERLADPGDLAVPGQPLLRLVDPSGLKVVADLPGVAAQRVARNTPVVVSIPALEARSAATIVRVSPALEAGSRRFRVEAVFDDAPPAGAIAGAYARLSLPAQGSGRRWVPADAVVRRGQLTGVFAVEDGELRLRWIRLGASDADAIELLAGPPGDLVVVREPSPLLRDGRPVGTTTEAPWRPRR